MDPVTIASIAIDMMAKSLAAAKMAGLIGNPNWVIYAEAGLAIAAKAAPIISDSVVNRDKYNTLTPAEIQTLLAPASWDEKEIEAAGQIAAEG